jgi:hypothetical protein
VVISDDGTGFANIGPSMRWRCVKRTFRQTEYLPQQVFDFPATLFSLVKLPRFTAPGLLYDGATQLIEDVASMDIDAVITPAPKPRWSAQIKLTPVDPTWPPAGVVNEADRKFA